MPGPLTSAFIDAHTLLQCSVLNGSNVLSRSFAYIHATVRNRLAFVKNARAALRRVDAPGAVLWRGVACRAIRCCVSRGPHADRGVRADGFTLGDVSLLLGLICEDFPNSLSEAAADVLRLSSVSRPVSLEPALRAILTLFVYTGTALASPTRRCCAAGAPHAWFWG